MGVVVSGMDAAHGDNKAATGVGNAAAEYAGDEVLILSQWSMSLKSSTPFTAIATMIDTMRQYDGRKSRAHNSPGCVASDAPG